MSETDPSHRDTSKHDAIRLPKDVKELAVYFEHKAIVDPTFSGYVHYASKMAGQIERIAYLSAAHEHLTEHAELRPGENPCKLYKNQAIESYGTKASTALVELAYQVTNARYIDAEIFSYINQGRVWYQGRYLGRPIQFIEIYDFDNYGEFKSLDIRTDAPGKMLAMHSRRPTNLRPDRRFYTTSETNEELVNFYENTLSNIETVPIDEVQVVKDYIKRRAA